jgi:hypothetical protein
VTSVAFIDDDVRVARHLRRRTRKLAAGDAADPPGVLFLEIDGLAYDVVRRAMRDGDTPFLASCVHDGSHHLLRWETDWSSQTGACQAGLLHGRNDDMPGFRWWEKDRDRPIVTNRPRDAAELERRVSDGRGLLHADGASRANILSGDAPHALLTMSRVLDIARVDRLGRDYLTYFRSPFNVARTFLMVIVDVVGELRGAALQRSRDVQPRIRRGFRYALLRAWATVVQRDLQVAAVTGDVQAGRPLVYTTFLAYDEVAHHSGLERADTLAVLRRVDREIARICRAAAEARRRYEIVVLADHGQTQGAPFRQRYGETLDAVVRRACATTDVVASGSGEDEALGRLGAALNEVAETPGAAGRAVARATRRRSVDGEVVLGREERAEPGIPEISVMASGCLGLISFPRLPGRLTRAELDARYPALLPTLRTHPGIGFVLVDGVVHGPRGWRLVRGGDAVFGEDPLAPFGPNAWRHVARTDGFAHCPDVLVNSTWWPDTDEVAAFEEFVGSHGGMGGPQSFPFVLAPAHLAMPRDEVVGAEAMHRVLRGWLAEMGHEAYR